MTGQWDVVIVGAGPVVGRPIAALLMQREATVISTNKYSRGVGDLARSADVVIAAAGVAGLIRALPADMRHRRRRRRLGPDGD